MDITLDHVQPYPLEGMVREDTEVWNQERVFEKGNYYGIWAPSGTGKSTLMLSVYGARYDYSGKIKLGKRAVSGLSGGGLASIRQKDISIVFQDLRLFTQLTAWENLEVKIALGSKYSQEEIIRMAARLNADNFLSKKVGTLSYGERQRIAILRALVQPFQWLLLDEPFSHLDEVNAGEAAALIMEVAGEQGAGILYTALNENNLISCNQSLWL